MKKYILLTYLFMFIAGSIHAATFTVSSVEDNVDITGTLRWAIHQANTLPGSDLIIFSTSNSIFAFSLLEVTDEVMIYSNKTAVIGGGSINLFIDSDGSTISGIAFVDGSEGVLIDQSNCHIIEKCHFGGDWAFASRSKSTGIHILNGSYNLIGGDETNKNVFISNTSRDINIVEGKNNIIQGNDIIGMSIYGIYLGSNAGATYIGGDRNLNRGNVIGGKTNSTGYAIYDVGFGGNTICGNIIGLSRDQTTSHSNDYGVYLSSPYNAVGLPYEGYENIITNNTWQSISLAGDKNTIRNNLIGLSSDDTMYSNGTGIQIMGSSNNNIIGGARNIILHQRNVISGNTIGVDITGDNNTISGNFIGLNTDGTQARANGQGVRISNGRNNLIGGSNQIAIALRGNVISANTTGIYIWTGIGNTVVGNFIGLDASATSTIGNTSYGIDVGTSYNLIGGDDTYLGNIICGGTYGIRLIGGQNKITNNMMGIMNNGALSTEIFTAAIYITGTDNMIGEKNVITKNNIITNATNCIQVAGVNADRNSFYGNTITAFSASGISLAGDGANDNKSAPAILLPVDVAMIQGTTGGSNDFVEVFVSNRGAGQYGGSLRSVGTTTAVSGNWSLVPTGLSGGEYVCAIATDSSGNSSGFSLNQQVTLPTPTATPTVTPTMTATPAAVVDIHSVEPEYNHAANTGTLYVRGNNFAAPASVRLSRSGMSDLSATGVQVISATLLTCKFDLTGLAYGPYGLRVDIPGAYGNQADVLKIIQRLEPPYQWNIADLGQAGTTAQASEARGLVVADGDNDGQKEVFSAGLLQSLLKYDLGGTTWSVTSLPAGGIGEYYTATLACDMDNDGIWEIYGSTLDHHVYQFSDADLSTKADISGDLGDPVYGMACGDGDHDNMQELYVVSGVTNDGYLYKFDYLAGWSNTLVAQSTGKMTAVACADGDNDSEQELYVACADHNVYQIKFDGVQWNKSIVATAGGAIQGLAVGDGNQDGENEVYYSSNDGNVYQAKWSAGFFWDTTHLASIAVRGIAIGDGDNNAASEVYLAAENGRVLQLQYQAGTWQSLDLGTAPSGLYSLALGDGDNDYQLELYALAGDSHVYQFKAVHAQPTATPTKTPIPDFDGSIISEKYVYAAPNPVRGHIANIVIHTLQPAEVSAKLYTTTNREVLSFRRQYMAGRNVERINVSDLANGVYLLLVKARATNGQEEKVLKKIAIVK